MAKLPHPLEAGGGGGGARSSRSLQMQSQDSSAPPGAYSEARAAAREQARREGVGLFGAQGLLGQLREAEAESDTASRREVAPVSGPPLNGARREAERRAAREAKVQKVLEERAMRLAAEAAAVAAPKMQRSSAAASAPELRLDLSATNKATKEDLDKQKLRIACKMEILQFFNGYSSAVGKMTAEQSKMLLAKLQKGSDETELADAMQKFELQREDQLRQWAEKQRVDDEQSIQRRLKQVNDFCNKAFEQQ